MNRGILWLYKSQRRPQEEKMRERNRSGEEILVSHYTLIIVFFQTSASRDYGCTTFPHPHPRTDGRKGKQEETGLKRERERERPKTEKKEEEEENRGEHINRGLFTHTKKEQRRRVVSFVQSTHLRHCLCHLTPAPSRHGEEKEQNRGITKKALNFVFILRSKRPHVSFSSSPPALLHLINITLLK